MGYKQGESITQGSLFPVCLDDLIPVDHGVRVIAAYVDYLNLEQLRFHRTRPSATGRPPYAPSDLLKLYLYGYLHRIRSSRRLESECQRNVEVMWLLGRLTPDFKTIAEFRRLNHAAFIATCRDFVQFCRRALLIKGQWVAIDGSKFQAASSLRQHITPDKLAKQQKELEKKIAQHLQQMDELDKQESGTQLDQKKVQAALALLKKQHQENAEQQTHLEEQNLTQSIKTEPDARVMRSPKGKHTAYNVQTAVDAEKGLILHHEVTQACGDNQQLLSMALAAKAVLEQKKLKAVADAGYSNGEHFSECEKHQIDAYVPVNRSVNTQNNQMHFDRQEFHYDEKSDSFSCPNGKRLHKKQMNKGVGIYAAQEADCAVCPLKPHCTQASRRYISLHPHEEAFERMHERLAANPEAMNIRRSTVEHPFGNLKQWIFGNGRFLLWGLRGAKTEMALGCLAYNLKRAINCLGVDTMRALLT